MQHWTRHVVGMEAKPKQGFDTLQDCEAHLRKLGYNVLDYTCYVCQECGKWHYGHYKQRK